MASCRSLNNSSQLSEQEDSETTSHKQYFSQFISCKDKVWPNLTHGENTVIFANSTLNKGQIIYGFGSNALSQSYKDFLPFISENLSGTYSLSSYKETGTPLPIAEVSKEKLKTFFQNQDIISAKKKTAQCLNLRADELSNELYPLMKKSEQVALLVHEHIHAFDQKGWSINRTIEEDDAEGPQLTKEQILESLYFRLNLTTELEKAIEGDKAFHLKSAKYWQSKFDQSFPSSYKKTIYATDIQEGMAQYAEALATAIFNAGHCEMSLAPLLFEGFKILRKNRPLSTGTPSIDSYYGGAYATMLLSLEKIESWQSLISEGGISPIVLLLKGQTLNDSNPEENITRSQVDCLFGDFF